jgi:hypothetical protein
VGIRRLLTRCHDDREALPGAIRMLEPVLPPQTPSGGSCLVDAKREGVEANVQAESHGRVGWVQRDEPVLDGIASDGSDCGELEEVARVVSLEERACSQAHTDEEPDSPAPESAGTRDRS